jgi:cytochrome c551/c552
MKTILLTALLAAGVLALGTAQASPELSKSAGCAECHEMDKKKGPPYTGSAGHDARGFDDGCGPAGMLRAMRPRAGVGAVMGRVEAGR